MGRLIIIILPLLVCFAMCSKPTPRGMKCELPQEAPMQLDRSPLLLYVLFLGGLLFGEEGMPPLSTSRWPVYGSVAHSRRFDPGEFRRIHAA
jgi:hypothetical protein